MAESTQREVSDGTLVLLDLSIKYLDRSEISVFFDSLPTAAWSWVGATEKRIAFSPAVPLDVEVLVRRTTVTSRLRHTFSLGAAFNAATLDEDLTQVLHIVQEAAEGNASGEFYQNVDMHGFRIRNIGTAVDDTDALTLGQYRTDALGAGVAKTLAENAAALSEASRIAAAASAVAASTSEGNAFTYMNNAAYEAGQALAHKTAAGISEGNANSYASAAYSSALLADSNSRLTVGSVATGAPGSSATVSITGASGTQAISFSIPQGIQGPMGIGDLTAANNLAELTNFNIARSNLGLTPGVHIPAVDGTGVYGTWGINITGNAGYASTAGSAGYATSAGNGGVTSVNGATGAVSVTPATTANVLAATAAAALNAVGTYRCIQFAKGSAPADGATFSAAGGSWRCMGFSGSRAVEGAGPEGVTTYYDCVLALRYA